MGHDEASTKDPLAQEERVEDAKRSIWGAGDINPLASVDVRLNEKAFVVVPNVAHIGVPSHKLESASNRHTDGQTPLPIRIDAGLKVSVAPQNIERKLFAATPGAFSTARACRRLVASR